MKKSFPLATALFFVTTALNCPAALINYEGFDITPDSNLVGLTPPGWGSAWAGTITAGYGTINAGSLAYPASTGFTSTGNKAALGANSSITSNRITFGTDFNYTASSDSVRYASLLLEKPAANGYVQFDLSNVSSFWTFGINSLNQAFLRTIDTAGSTAASSVTSATINTGGTLFLISKLVVSSSGQQSVYLNWYTSAAEVPLTEPTTWMLSTSNINTATAAYNQFSVATGASTNPSMIDEIRLGTEWNDVAAIPEPVTSVLAALGLLASYPLLARRRKSV